MFCTNCGAQFEGSFCPQCGAKAFSSSEAVKSSVSGASKEYPAPPIGEYKASPGILTIGREEIVIKSLNKELHIPFQAIIAARCSTAPLGGDLYIRWDKQKIPNSDLQTRKDSHLFEFVPSRFRQFQQAYDFLDQVARINSPAAAERDLQKSVNVKAEASAPLSPKERIRENQKNGVACCPKCGSTSLSASKKGFGVGKAAAGRFLLSSWYGLAAGGIGSNKVIVTCLNCGHKWKL